MSAVFAETTAADLRDAMNRLAAGLPFAAVRGLIDLGVPAWTVGALTGAGLLGLADVDLLRGGRFQLGGPVRRLLLAVPAGATARAGYSSAFEPDIVDIVALSSTNPDEWALLTGEGTMLGAEQLEHAIAAERRELRLHPTPLAWLRSGMEGVAVLEWGSAALGALRGLRPFQTIMTDPGAGPVLEKMLAFGGLPLVAEARGRMPAHEKDRVPVRRAA